MAMDYTRLGARIGKILGGLNEVNTYRGTTLATRVDTLANQYGVSNPNGDLTVSIYDQQDQANVTMNGWVTYLSSFLESVIGAELDNDVPMTDTSLSARIAELRRRMAVDSQSFNECPGTVTVADVGTPTGDHAIVATTREFTGRISDYLVPDVYLLICTADRSQGGTAYAETFSIAGKPIDQLPTDATYPSGTGITGSITSLDPATDGGLVTDGIFNDLTGSAFTSWTSNGVWNTTVAQAADDPRDGASGFCLRLVGNGVLVHKITQEVDVEAGGVYTAFCRIKRITDPGTDWGVSLILVDGAGNTLSGGSYSNVLTSVTAASVGTAWQTKIQGTFVAPQVLPATGVFLEVRFHQFSSLTTAAANTAEVYVSHVCLHDATPLYAGGCALNIYSGLLEGVVGDARTATVALSSGVPADFVIRGMDRLLGLASLSTRLLTSSSETILDSVIS